MTEIMGILNLTPDSFSGDGQYGAEAGTLLARVDAMVADGAHSIDVGAESTRPGATSLSADEEWERIAPLAKSLGNRTDSITFSIDTYHPENAKRALDAGFAWVNDVSGGSAAMFASVKPYDAMLVLMHSLSVPVDKTKMLPADAGPVETVFAWGRKALETAGQAGIKRERIVLDPGIGFGKTPAQSFALLHNIKKFKEWEVPLLVGHSRKSFLAALSKDIERDAATLSVSMFLALQGIDYIRVHDVRAHKAMLQVLQALT